MTHSRNVKVDEFIEGLPGDIKAMTERLRNLIHAADGNLKEQLKWKMPCFSKDNADICYLQTAQKHVNLGFYSGAVLQDGDHLLEGEGKKMRHIRIRKMEDIQ